MRNGYYGKKDKWRIIFQQNYVLNVVLKLQGICLICTMHLNNC